MKADMEVDMGVDTGAELNFSVIEKYVLFK